MEQFWNFLCSNAFPMGIVFVLLLGTGLSFCHTTQKINKINREYQEREQKCQDRRQKLHDFYSQFDVIMRRDKPLHLINKTSGDELTQPDDCEFHIRKIVPWSELFKKGLILSFDGCDISKDNPDKAPHIWFRPKNNVKIDDAFVKFILEDEMVIESKSLGRIYLKKEKDIAVGSPIPLFQRVKETPQGCLVFYTSHIEV